MERTGYTVPNRSSYDFPSVEVKHLPESFSEFLAHITRYRTCHSEEYVYVVPVGGLPASGVWMNHPATLDMAAPLVPLSLHV